MSDDEIQNIDKIKVYKKRKTKMDDYSNIIFKMLIDEIEQEYIFAYVKEKGCKASDRYLANYINLLAKNNGFTYKKRSTFIEKVYPDNVTVITRYDLLKYLLTLDKETSTNTNIENNINIIFEKYPIAKEIKSIFNDFLIVKQTIGRTEFPISFNL